MAPFVWGLPVTTLAFRSVRSFIVRAGLLGSVSLDAHLEAQVSLIPVWVSPDSLGLAGGDFGQLGVRLRWARRFLCLIQSECGRSRSQRGSPRRHGDTEVEARCQRGSPRRRGD